MSLSNQNMSMFTLKQSVYDTVSYRSIRFPYCTRTGGWQKYSLQCYCTTLTHQLLSGADARFNRSTRILVHQFDLKKCKLTVQENIYCYSCRDRQ